MKNNFSSLLPSLLFLAFFCSCQKSLDYSKVEEKIGTPLPGQSTNCRIESIWANIGEYGEEIRLILYDEYENPIIITTLQVGTGHPYITFKYDSWHRLREYRGDYTNGSFEFLHLYGYDHQGRIGVDTTYYFGGLTDTGFHYSDRSISAIQYDSQNRINKVTADYERGNFQWILEYNYDADGNLIQAGAPGIMHDNKVNLYRTNDIWMFLARDYSVNNPFVADTYNPTGFPTKIKIGSGTFNFVSLNIRLNNCQVSYGCKQAYW